MATLNDVRQTSQKISFLFFIAGYTPEIFDKIQQFWDRLYDELIPNDWPERAKKLAIFQPNQAEISEKANAILAEFNAWWDTLEHYPKEKKT